MYGMCGKLLKTEQIWKWMNALQVPYTTTSIEHQISSFTFSIYVCTYEVEWTETRTSGNRIVFFEYIITHVSLSRWTEKDLKTVIIREMGERHHVNDMFSTSCIFIYSHPKEPREILTECWARAKQSSDQEERCDQYSVSGARVRHSIFLYEVWWWKWGSAVSEMILMVEEEKWIKCF